MYYMNTDIEDKRNGRLVELDDNTHVTQSILKKLFNTAIPPSREHKHDRFAEAVLIKGLRDAGMTWPKIGEEVGKSAHAVQSLQKRYYHQKCPMCGQSTMKKFRATPGDYWWECTNGECNGTKKGYKRGKRHS